MIPVFLAEVEHEDQLPNVFWALLEKARNDDVSLEILDFRKKEVIRWYWFFGWKSYRLLIGYTLVYRFVRDNCDFANFQTKVSFGSVGVSFSGGSDVKEIFMALGDGEDAVISITPQTLAGAEAPIDGVPVWEDVTEYSDGQLPAFSFHPHENGMSCRVKKVSQGEGLLRVQADATIGPGEKEIFELYRIVVAPDDADVIVSTIEKVPEEVI